MCLGMLKGITGSHLSLWPQVMEMTPFGRGKPGSHVPEEYWLLSNNQKSPLKVHLWLFELPFGAWGVGISLDLTTCATFPISCDS